LKIIKEKKKERAQQQKIDEQEEILKKISKRIMRVGGVSCFSRYIIIFFDYYKQLVEKRKIDIFFFLELVSKCDTSLLVVSRRHFQSRLVR
jgi:hypothetical protein